MGTVYSAFGEVRSEIKALSEQLGNSIPHQSGAVNRINGGLMTMGEPALASGVCSGPLRISILGASGLRNADWAPGTGVSDPYCTCEIRGKPHAAKIETHVVKNNLDPTWDYEAELPEFAAGDCLVFKVCDQDFGKSDDFLGTLSLMSEQFYPHGFDGALPLQMAGKGNTANLRLRIPPVTMVNPVAEMALGGPHVVQLAAALEKEMAKRIESEALLQHELANVADRVEQLSHRGLVDGEGPRPELPVVQQALTKAEQSLVASSNLQNRLEELRPKVDRIRAELDAPMEEF